MWNYAQHFAMSDNAFGDTYGPSTPGMLNVSSGQTNGMTIVATTKQPSTVTTVSYYINDGPGGLPMINDVDPGYDVYSNPKDQATMSGKTIGGLLNGGGITWGSFMGGFRLDTTNANGSTGCKRATHSTVVGADVVDYIPHHAWFQYYASTANPKHERPSSLAAIGYSLEQDGTTRDPANHNYDLSDFYDAVKAGNFPAVSYIKMPAYQDGHAAYSDPLDEQKGTVSLINFLEQQPDWKDAAVVVAWDDSDGWYDHVFTKVTSPSFDAEADQLNGPGNAAPVRRRPATAANRSTATADPARKSRSSSFRHGRKKLFGHGQITFSSVVASSKTIGCPDDGSAAARSTQPPDRSTACSISTVPARTPRFISIRKTACRCRRRLNRETRTEDESATKMACHCKPVLCRRARGRGGRFFIPDARRKPASDRACASTERTAVGHGRARPADFLRCKPILVRPALVRLVPLPAACLWATG